MWVCKKLKKMLRKLSFVTPHQIPHQYFMYNRNSLINLFLLQHHFFVRRTEGIVRSLRHSIKMFAHPWIYHMGASKNPWENLLSFLLPNWWFRKSKPFFFPGGFTSSCTPLTVQTMGWTSGLDLNSNPNGGDFGNCSIILLNCFFVSW